MVTSKSAEFTEKVTKETGDSLGAITSATEQATGTLQLTAKDFVLAFTDLVETKTQEATGEIDDAVEIHKSELNRTAQGLTDKFKETVTDAEGDIIKEIGTQVTQNARQWKVEVMGEDKDGNPNTILAAINADESGIKIEGERVQISGQLLVEAIMTTGINIDDKFIVSVENGKAKVTMKGEIYADSGTFSGFLKIPFKTFKEGAIPNAATGEYTVSDYFNLEAKGEDTATRLILNLPTDEKYIGTVLTVYDNPVKTRIAPIVEIKGRMYHPLNVDVYGLKLVTKIETGKGGVIQFIGVSRYDGCVWYVITDSLGESTRT